MVVLSIYLLLNEHTLESARFLPRPTPTGRSEGERSCLRDVLSGNSSKLATLHRNPYSQEMSLVGISYLEPFLVLPWERLVSVTKRGRRSRQVPFSFSVSL
ncbi:hypothetical protein RRG08_042225 [Elysia crispata]|uniref:Uncharacterized protein n=1 Tax=Elysia crispata TaxID=231223 RepID=A0AAE1ASQ6_9GAST|nr:hypothetical protein RRG08_042225 [Elysia crispata]